VYHVAEHPVDFWDDIKQMVADFSSGNDYQAGLEVANLISILDGNYNGNVTGSINIAILPKRYEAKLLR